MPGMESKVIKRMNSFTVIKDETHVFRVKLSKPAAHYKINI